MTDRQKEPADFQIGIRTGSFFQQKGAFGEEPGTVRGDDGERRKRLSQRARRRQRNRSIAAVVAAAAAGLLVWFGMNGVRRERAADFPPVQGELLEADPQEGRPPIDVQLLTPNPYSRPQEAMGTIREL